MQTHEEVLSHEVMKSLGEDGAIDLNIVFVGYNSVFFLGPRSKYRGLVKVIKVPFSINLCHLESLDYSKAN